MSTNGQNNQNENKVQNAITTAKKSFWGELNAVSGAVLIGLIVLVIGSIALYVFMNIVPPKKTVVIDDADVFSEAELEQLKEMAEDLQKENDINVVIATTRNNPYGTSDSDCKKYAAKFYSDNCISSSMKDNSGICIYIDLTVDRDGMRFFWLYTYGSAYYSVSDSDCSMLFIKQKSVLKEQEYALAIRNIIRSLDEYDYHSSGLMMIYGCSIGLPLILALIVTAISTMKNHLDPVPASSEYKAKKKSKVIEQTDVFLRKTTRSYTSSSSSGGGGGGGGGGHSGGGGGRF